MSGLFDFNEYHRAWVAWQDALPEEHNDSPKRIQKVLADPSITNTIPLIVCADGFSMSVQASEHTYCTPRKYRAWPYARAEVGYPSAPEPIIEPWAEDSGALTETVYGYVPLTHISAVVDAHGGCVSWPPVPYETIPQ